MSFQNNNGAAIGVGVAIFNVVIIIIIVVAFGCNGGWFGRYGNNNQAYVALSQKKAAKAPQREEEEEREQGQPAEVVLAQHKAGASEAGSGEVAHYSSQLYDGAITNAGEETARQPTIETSFPNSDKAMETIHGGDPAQNDITELDKNKITYQEMKQRYNVQVDRHMLYSRNGASRITGISSSLLRPWYEDFVAAQKRACARRERKQKSGCDDDDSCVQFNESSFMYDSCE